jgi:hypothetical protein
VFPLPAAEASLRLTALGPEEAVLDRWTQQVDLPAVPPGALPMGTLAFYRARTVLELRALRDAPSAAPTAARRFVRTDRVYVDASAAPEAGEVQATAELLNKAGQPLAPLPCDVSGGRVRVDLPLTSLVPSTYLLRVRVVAGERSAEQVAAFDVAR